MGKTLNVPCKLNLSRRSYNEKHSMFLYFHVCAHKQKMLITVSGFNCPQINLNYITPLFLLAYIIEHDRNNSFPIKPKDNILH